MNKFPFIDTSEPRFQVSALSQVEDWGLTYVGVRKWRDENHVTGAGIRVAILDTGVSEHTDMPSVMKVDTTGSGPMDRNGHGTHCAGIIAAVDNGVGVIGAAPGVELISIKVLNDCGLGDWEQITAGINEAVNLCCDVISMSLGARMTPPRYLTDAIERAVKSGIIICAAAGNDGEQDPQAPASCVDVYAVGAIGKDEEILNFSVKNSDVFCPGSDIYSCWLDNSFAKLDGTSQATPMVSAVMALLLEKHCHNIEMALVEFHSMLDENKILKMR